MPAYDPAQAMASPANIKYSLKMENRDGWGGIQRIQREEGESQYLQKFKAPDYCCYCLLFVVVIRTKNRQHTHVHVECRQRFGHNGVTAGQSADAGGGGGGGGGGEGGGGGD